MPTCVHVYLDECDISTYAYITIATASLCSDLTSLERSVSHMLFDVALLAQNKMICFA